jgi:hypothetical protein
VSEWAAFFSYAHHDDEAQAGRLRKLAVLLGTEVKSQTGKAFEIFVDREDIQWGTNWERALGEGLERSTFLIPVITPSYFVSEYCREELTRFLDKEKRLGRDDLVLPVYYIDAPVLSDESLRSGDKLASALQKHQYVDWRKLRRTSLQTKQVGIAIDEMAARLRTSIAAPSTGSADRIAQTGSGDEAVNEARAQAAISETAVTAREAARRETVGRLLIAQRRSREASHELARAGGASRDQRLKEEATSAYDEFIDLYHLLNLDASRDMWKEARGLRRVLGAMLQEAQLGNAEKCEALAKVAQKARQNLERSFRMELGHEPLQARRRLGEYDVAGE